MKKKGKQKHHAFLFSGSADYIRVDSSLIPAYFSIFRCLSGSFRYIPVPLLPSLAVNKTRIGFQIGLGIGSDWYLRLRCKIIILRKAVLTVTQVTRNKKIMEVAFKMSFAYLQQVVAIIPCSFPRFS